MRLDRASLQVLLQLFENNNNNNNNRSTNDDSSNSNHRNDQYVTSLDSVVPHNNNSIIINWLEFQNFLLQRMNPKSVKDRIRYAKQYWYVLESGDAQELFQLNIEKRMHVLKSLANLAKYTGR